MVTILGLGWYETKNSVHLHTQAEPPHTKLRPSLVNMNTYYVHVYAINSDTCILQGSYFR